MIAFLEGKIAEKNIDSVIVDTGGVGWDLRCSMQTSRSLPQLGANARVYTRMIVREDAMDIYGFAAQDERMMFDKLRDVSGIGAKSALSILSTLSVKDLLSCVSASDISSLSKAPGIGKKTAARIIMELRDKLKLPDQPFTDITPSQIGSAQAEAVSALAALGYSAQEAQKLVARVIAVRLEGLGTEGGASAYSTEDIVRDALRMIRL